MQVVKEIGRERYYPDTWPSASDPQKRVQEWTAAEFFEMRILYEARVVHRNSFLLHITYIGAILAW